MKLPDLSRIQKRLTSLIPKKSSKRKGVRKRAKRVSRTVLHIERPDRKKRFHKPTSSHKARRITSSLEKRLAKFVTPKVLMLSIAVALGGILFGLTFFSRLFLVQDINVARDVYYVSTERIQEVLSDSLGEHMFFLNTKELELRLLREYPFMKSVHVKKLFPHSLSVEMSSFEIVGLIGREEQESPFLLSENGVVLEDTRLLKEGEDTAGILHIEVPTYSYDEPLTPVVEPYVELIHGKRFVQEEHMEAILEMFELLENNFSFSIAKAEYLPLEEEVHIHLQDGPQLLFWLAEPIKTQVYKLKRIEEEQSVDLGSQNHVYVDLRIPDRVDVCDAGQGCAGFVGRGI